jgi:hypothetical protein
MNDDKEVGSAVLVNNVEGIPDGVYKLGAPMAMRSPTPAEFAFACGHLRFAADPDHRSTEPLEVQDVGLTRVLNLLATRANLVSTVELEAPNAHQLLYAATMLRSSCRGHSNILRVAEWLENGASP